MKTVRLTMAQALVRFLENQYMEVDGAQHRFVRGVFIIPGHGNVVGLGQALSQEAKHLEIYQGKNEQCCPATPTPAVSPTPFCSRWSTPTPWPPPPMTLSRLCAATGTALSVPSS